MPVRPYPIQIPPSTNGWSGYLITKGLCSADSNIDRKFKQHLQTHLEPRQKQQQRHIHHHQTPHQKNNLSLIKSSSRHLSELSNYPSDFLLWGGPYLRKPVVSSNSSTSSIQEPLDMSGSVLLAWANSPEEVKDVLQKDIFTKEKVWNWEEIRILPFKSTVRKAM